MLLVGVVFLLLLLLLAIVGSYWGYRRYGPVEGVAAGLVVLLLVVATAFVFRNLPHRPESSATSAPPAAPRGTGP